MALSDEQQLGRAKNAVLILLERKLSVPKIYLDATWYGSAVDVLAFDRDGSGDVHIAIVFAQKQLPGGLPNCSEQERAIDEASQRIRNIPAHYRYVAGVVVGNEEAKYLMQPTPRTAEKMFEANGLGRIGFIAIDAPLDDEPSAHLIVKPERFRAPVTEAVDSYMRQHTADWEVRV